MIPLQVTIVPLYLALAQVGLTNTLWSLILPPIFSAFGIFLMRQHFLSLPNELEEAARIDGAGQLRMFFQVMIPLSGPALATLAIITFTYWWNDLFTPLVMISSVNTETLPVGLQHHSSGRISQCNARRLLPTLRVDHPETLGRRPHGTAARGG